MESLETEAVVVRLVNYGEADRIVTLLTRHAGKLSALARGARKSQRRFAGSLALFSIGEAHLRKRQGDLWSLESFHTHPEHLGMEADLASLAHAAYLCELARELVPDEARDEQVFMILVTSLAALRRESFSACDLRRYELHLLSAIGWAPVLDRCLACGATPTDDVPPILDAERGGIICGACSKIHESFQEYNKRTIAIALPEKVRCTLAALQQNLPDHAWSTLTPLEAGRARETMQALLEQHLTRPLRSLEFITKLNESSMG